MIALGIIDHVRDWLIWLGGVAASAGRWIAPSRRAAVYWAAILALAAIMLLIRQDQYHGCVRASAGRWEQAQTNRALADALPIAAPALLDSADRLENYTAPTQAGREDYCNDVVPRWLIRL